MTRLTPKQLTLAADHMAEIGYRHAALSLREAAAELKREQDAEQAAEKRIDELAQIFHTARNEAHGWTPNWEHLEEHSQNGYRTGIRAVLGKLDQDETLADGIIEGFARQDDGYSDQPFGKDGHFRRQWGDLRLIPDDVTEVVASNKHRATRNPEATYGWQWKHSGSPLAPTGALAPYIAIAGGDQ